MLTPIKTMIAFIIVCTPQFVCHANPPVYFGEDHTTYKTPGDETKPTTKRNIQIAQVINPISRTQIKTKSTGVTYTKEQKEAIAAYDEVNQRVQEYRSLITELLTKKVKVAPDSPFKEYLTKITFDQKVKIYGAWALESLAAGHIKDQTVIKRYTRIKDKVLQIEKAVKRADTAADALQNAAVMDLTLSRDTKTTNLIYWAHRVARAGEKFILPTNGWESNPDIITDKDLSVQVKSAYGPVGPDHTFDYVHSSRGNPILLTIIKKPSDKKHVVFDVDVLPDGTFEAHNYFP